jgi:hypothetical protein
MPDSLSVLVACVSKVSTKAGRKAQRFEYSETMEPLIRTVGTITANGSDKDTLVELVGLEPTTSTLPAWRSPS